MYTPDIIFRADGNSTRGLGHLYRCMAIAGAFNKKQTCFVGIDFPDQVLTDLEQSFGRVIKLNNKNNDNGLLELLSLISKDKVVVLDGYQFDKNYRLALKDKKCKTVMIDDMYLDFTGADMVLNPSPEAIPDRYSGKGNPEFCFGFSFAPVRKIFSEPYHMERNKITAFIAMGGADPLNLAGSIACELAKTELFERIIVLTKLEIPKYKGVEIETHSTLTADEIKHFFASSTVCILPASTMAMEAMTVGTPLALGYFIDNQESLYRGFIKSELAVGLGNLNNWDAVDWEFKLSELMKKETQQKLINNQTKVFDGNSLIRIKDKINLIRTK